MREKIWSSGLAASMQINATDRAECMSRTLTPDFSISLSLDSGTATSEVPLKLCSKFQRHGSKKLIKVPNLWLRIRKHPAAREHPPSQDTEH